VALGKASGGHLEPEGGASKARRRDPIRSRRGAVKAWVGDARYVARDVSVVSWEVEMGKKGGLVDAETRGVQNEVEGM